MSRRQRKKFQETFAQFDKDSSGSISAGELKTMMQALGHRPTDDDIIDILASVDKDHSGFIEVDEFLAMMARRVKVIENIEEVKRAFRLFDVNGDGFVSKEEVGVVMINMGDKMTDGEIEILMEKADINKDGRMDYEEFVTMMAGSMDKV